MKKDLTLLYQIKSDIDKTLRESDSAISYFDRTKETEHSL